jgi:hypothetical protein
MATLIPALSSCNLDADGERRLAHRIHEKLGEEWICWVNVPVGPLSLHPDFILLHPAYGLLVLEVKDWKKDTLVSANKKKFQLRTFSWEGSVDNPFVQARKYEHAVVNELSRDPLLIHAAGDRRGKLQFPVACGVVLAGITRKQFEETGLSSVLGSHLVLCQDEMTETADPEAFQDRLTAMFAYRFGEPLSETQVDRVRWHLFPEVRIPKVQLNLFEERKEDVERVMDLKQEQLARSLGEGHRIIHGVAGSGKTMILGYRAEFLARASQRPILVLCYNRALSKRLGRANEEKRVQQRIHVRTFHQWCHELLRKARVSLPPKRDGEDFFNEMVRLALNSTEVQRVARELYSAILIDEAHDFEAAWLSFIARSVDPRTNSLLVLYDDAQSIYARDRKRFSFKSVGIQAAGRTTILRVNYRNTQEILNYSASVVRDLLAARDSDDDGIPLVTPVGGGGSGPRPRVIKCASLAEEADFIAARFREANHNGTPWNQMAVIYRSYPTVGKEVLAALRRHKLPVTYHAEATFAADENTIKVLNMHVCKGLEFAMVAIPGAGQLKLAEGDGDEDARLLYVAMTRAKRELIICQSGDKNAVLDA